jgi:hypothetical protein
MGSSAAHSAWLARPTPLAASTVLESAQRSWRSVSGWAWSLAAAPPRSCGRCTRFRLGCYQLNVLVYDSWASMAWPLVLGWK